MRASVRLRDGRLCEPDLHASEPLAADDRDGLERMLRYGGRPAIAQERLTLLTDGRVSLELKRPYYDGTTHLAFEPLVFIERLAALVPKPNKNLVIYSGVLAPNAKLRSAVVAYGRPLPAPAANLAAPDAAAPPGNAVTDSNDEAPSNPEVVDAEAPPGDTLTTVTEPSNATPPIKLNQAKPKRPNYAWPELMRRSFSVNVLQCKDCGGTLKLIDIVTHPRAIHGILKSLSLPTEPPLVRESRAPPNDDLDSA
jgi:hypothetical protein